MEIPPLLILFGALTTGNILLTNFLGMCSFLAVSTKMRSAVGLGVAVTFVLACTAPLCWLAEHRLLVPCGLEYLRTIVFILIIAAFTQIVEMAIERLSTPLYLALGLFLPLIAVNCAILGACLFLVIRAYSFWQSVAWGVGAGGGWMLAIVLLAGLRERMAKKSRVPPALEGPGIALILAGILALAFVGFSGMLRISG